MHSAKVSDLEVVESKLCLSAMIRSDSQDMFLGLVVDLVVDADEKSSNLQSEREFLDSLTLIEPSAMETVFGKVTKPGSRSQMCIPYGVLRKVSYSIRYGTYKAFPSTVTIAMLCMVFNIPIEYIVMSTRFNHSILTL